MLRKAVHPGLCAMCIRSRRIASDQGSEFWLCRRGLTEPEFAKYPRLPVMRCGGYEPAAEPSDRKQAEDAAPESEADE